MDIHYTLHEIQFEWDQAKAEANFIKHHVEFETACETFFDPFIYALDIEQHDSESRETFLGMTLQWNVLYVVYMIRQDDIFRIISARPATAAERRSYEEQ
jgi:uncharacterized DUF497 family protein